VKGIVLKHFTIKGLIILMRIKIEKLWRCYHEYKKIVVFVGFRIGTAAGKGIS
jgi:hypothetical protein